MSKILTLLTAAHLVVDTATIETLNPIIFKSLVIGGMSGLTVSEGKHFKIDTARNTAVEVTADAISVNAKSALETQKDADGSLAIAENFGLVSSLKLVHDADGSSTCRSDILQVTKSLNMKIVDIEVTTQNDIIFKTTGINNLSNLTKDGEKYYALDTAKNTATLIDADMVAKKAVADFLKGKTSDFTQLADTFKLIASVTLEKIAA